MKHIVAISGGKDSVAMALRLRELFPHRVYDYVITPTGDELPEMVAHWKKLQSILGPFRVLPNKTLIQLIEEKKMLPNFRARWCTVQTKIKPFIEYMSSLDSDSVMYVGLRADEGTRLGIEDDNAQYQTCYPMRGWNWDLQDVLNYLKYKRVTIPERTDCGCCFYQRLGEWKNLMEKYPDRYEQYVQLEKKIGHTFRSPKRDNWSADLDGLRREFLSGRKIRKTSIKKSEKCRFCSM